MLLTTVVVAVGLLYFAFSLVLRMNAKVKTVVVVGGGATGLPLAAMLAKSARRNLRVVVLERNVELGGGLHTFKRTTANGKPVTHETGCHYVGRSVVEFYRKIEDADCFDPVDGVYDKVYVALRHVFSYDKHWQTELTCVFPEQTEEIAEYVRMVNQVRSLQVPLAVILRALIRPGRCLRVLLQWLCPVYTRMCSMTVDDAIRRCGIKVGSNLYAALIGQWGDYGLPPCKASFFVHAAVTNHYTAGAFVPKGGPRSLVSRLRRRIKGANLNNIVLADARVTGLVTNDARVTGVRYCRQGQECVMSCDLVVFTTGKMVSSRLLKRAVQPYRVKNTLVGLFVRVLKRAALPSFNMWLHDTANFNKDAFYRSQSEDGLCAPLSVFVSSSTAKVAGSYTYKSCQQHAVTVLATAEHAWSPRSLGPDMHDSTQYAMWRSAIKHRLMHACMFFCNSNPTAAEAITEADVEVEFADPVTFQKYVHGVDGQVYGALQDVDALHDDVAVRDAQYGNVLHAGQDYSTCGIGGAAVSAEVTYYIVQALRFFKLV